MPSLPWVKWFPQDWISDPGLAMCDLSTKGLWIDAVNIMLLSGQPFIEGSDDQLARALRCRVSQLRAAISELRQFNVCIVDEIAECKTDANSMQMPCIKLTCRRLLRTHKTKAGRHKAAVARWGNPLESDANAMQTSYERSASAYAYASKGGTGGNPTVTVNTPLQSRAPDSVGLEERRGDEISNIPNSNYEKLVVGLSKLYQRSPDKPLTRLEMEGVLEVARNPGCLDELTKISDYRGRIPGKDQKYFPGSLRTLCEKWNDVLDRSNNHKEERCF